MDTMNSAEAARYVSLTVKRLQQLDREGRLKPISRTASGRRVYLKADLDRWLGLEPKTDAAKETTP